MLMPVSLDKSKDLFELHTWNATIGVGRLRRPGDEKVKMGLKIHRFCLLARTGEHVCYLVNMKGNHDFLVVIGYHRSTR